MIVRRERRKGELRKTRETGRKLEREEKKRGGDSS